jgi:hypothetical protein
MNAKSYYHRNLPHGHPPGAAIFLTCRLYGSLPETVIQQLKETQKLVEREIDKASRSAEKIAELKLNQHKKLFAKLDTILDKTTQSKLALHSVLKSGDGRPLLSERGEVGARFGR